MNTGQKRFLALIIALLIGITIPIALILNSQQPNSNLELTKIGQIDTGGGTEYVKVVGDIAYVIDQGEPTPGGLVLINVSDPANPSQLSSFHDGGWPQSLDVVEDIVYVADTIEGLEIIDVSDPRNPSEIGQYRGSGEVYDVQVIDDIAYIADWNNGLVIINVTEPSNPSYMSSCAIVGAAPHLHIANNMAFVIDHRSESSGFVAVDISDPHDPDFAVGYVPDADLWNPFVLEDYMYVCNHGEEGGELQILDMTNLSNITQIGMFTAGGFIFAVQVESDIAYLAGAEDGLLVVNITNPQEPRLLDSFYDGGVAVNLDFVNDIIYVADRSGGLEIFQLS
ncbi:MAG: LVIVD repeat-containing protein [Candidatus Thorarchaeota archaeon]